MPTSPNRSATVSSTRPSTALLAATVVTTGEVIPRPAHGASAGHTILIVDDEPQNRKLLEALLRPEGYVTLTANNGEEALAPVRLQLPGSDPARRDDARHGRLRGGEDPQDRPRHVAHPDHHGDGPDRSGRPPRRPQCRGRGVPDQAGQPGRAVAAGPQPAATQRAPGPGRTSEPVPRRGGVGAHGQAAALSHRHGRDRGWDLPGRRRGQHVHRSQRDGVEDARLQPPRVSRAGIGPPGSDHADRAGTPARRHPRWLDRRVARPRPKYGARTDGTSPSRYIATRQIVRR